MLSTMFGLSKRWAGVAWREISKDYTPPAAEFEGPAAAKEGITTVPTLNSSSSCKLKWPPKDFETRQHAFDIFRSKCLRVMNADKADRSVLMTALRACMLKEMAPLKQAQAEISEDEENSKSTSGLRTRIRIMHENNDKFDTEITKDTPRACTSCNCKWFSDTPASPR